MSTQPRTAKVTDYIVTPVNSTATYQLTVKIDRKPPIILQSLDLLFLARLGHLITHNQMLYAKALQLCDLVISGKIPQGHLPNGYLYPKLAYRVVFGYSSFKSAVCNHYSTAEEAYNSPIFQQAIAEAASKYGHRHELAEFLAIVEQGLPYTILSYTIIHSCITATGSIRGYAFQPQHLV